MNDSFGGGLLDDRDGPDKALSGLICRIIAHGSPHLFDRSFGLGLVSYISQSSYFTLSGPLEG